MSQQNNMCSGTMGMLAAAVTLACLSAGSAAAANKYWAVSSGNWSTNSNWDAGEPVAGDAAYITNQGTATITLPGEACNNIYLGTDTGLGGGSIVMDSGDLTTGAGGTAVRVGRGPGNTGTFTINGGVFQCTQLQVGRRRAQGYFYQSNGTVNVVGSIYVGLYGGNGHYEFSGGQLSSPQLDVGYSYTLEPPIGIGDFIQVGGTNTTGLFRVGAGWDDGSTGTYTLSNGYLTATGGVYVGQLDAMRVGTNPLVGTINQSGGTFTVTPELYLGSDWNNSHSVGRYNFTGGTLTDGAADANLYVRGHSNAVGTFCGRGTLALSGILENNGQVIADGGLLDMTSFAALTNQIENTALNGWFAMNGGSLRLPVIPVATGAGSYNWGESPDDANLDLVNSVRITFDNVTGAGAFSNELFATNSAALPAPIPATNKFQGVWRMGFSGTFSNQYALEFRYDPTPYHSERVQPQVFHCEDGQWVSYPATKLPGYRVRAANMNIDLSTSQWFAVQVDLPKGTVIAVYPQLR